MTCALCSVTISRRYQRTNRVRLAFFQEKSQREISALTKIPLGTVKTRIELGIKKLSHALGGLREKVV